MLPRVGLKLNASKLETKPKKQTPWPQCQVAVTIRSTLRAQKHGSSGISVSCVWGWKEDSVPKQAKVNIQSAAGFNQVYTSPNTRASMSGRGVLLLRVTELYGFVFGSLGQGPLSSIKVSLSSIKVSLWVYKVDPSGILSWSFGLDH